MRVVIKTRRTGETADRFIRATIELIEERGGSQNVNLREVARRVGIAHTNVYHYFDGLTGLMWETLRRAVVVYATALSDGLRDDLPPFEYFRKFVENMVAFPQEHPGLHRFVSSDPIEDGIPQDIVAMVAGLKQWADDVISACAPGVSAEVAADTCNIIVAYIGGESLNLINDRFLPGEDLPRRTVDYSLRLFTLLTGFDGTSSVEPPAYPRLILT